MRTKQGDYVRIVVSLPLDVVERIKRAGIPLSLYTRQRVSLMLSNLNIIFGVLRSCFTLEECDRKPKKAVGVYLHEKEYRVLLYHVKHINAYLTKYKSNPVKLNSVLYILLTDECHERKDI